MDPKLELIKIQDRCISGENLSDICKEYSSKELKVLQYLYPKAQPYESTSGITKLELNTSLYENFKDTPEKEAVNHLVVGNLDGYERHLEESLLTGVSSERTIFWDIYLENAILLAERAKSDKGVRVLFGDMVEGAQRLSESYPIHHWDLDLCIPVDVYFLEEQAKKPLAKHTTLVGSTRKPSKRSKDRYLEMAQILGLKKSIRRINSQNRLEYPPHQEILKKWFETYPEKDVDITIKTYTGGAGKSVHQSMLFIHLYRN